MHDMYTHGVIGFDKLGLLGTRCSAFKYYRNRNMPKPLDIERNIW